jgi:hypothetical protein
MKIGHGSNSGIEGFCNLGIEGILPVVSFCVERSIKLIERSDSINPKSLQGRFQPVGLQAGG